MAQARRQRFWERAAPALRVVGAILLAAGMIHLYADLVIFDARAFGARAALSLGDPRVAGFVAERITDEVVAQKRDLMAFRPLLVGTTRTIVGSEPFRAGFRRAAQSAHTTLFSQSAERLALSVPDLGVLVRSALAHDPALAGRVPASLRGSILLQPPGKAARALVAPRQARPPVPPQRLPGDRLGPAPALPRRRHAARSPQGAPGRRGGPRLRRPRPLLPAPARPHRPHRLDTERGAAAGGGGSVGRLRGRAPPVGARPRRHRHRPRVGGVVVTRATSRSRRSDGASGAGCGSRRGRGKARSSGPLSSPGSGSWPRSARPRPSRA